MIAEWLFLQHSRPDREVAEAAALADEAGVELDSEMSMPSGEVITAEAPFGGILAAGQFCECKLSSRWSGLGYRPASARSRGHRELI